MITGEGDFSVIDGSHVQTRSGLGLLPKDVLVDQHFIKRQRENRLFGLILGRSNSLGLGIDEGTALVVTDNRYAEVLGASRVMMVKHAGQSKSLLITLIEPGEKIDLLKEIPAKSRRSKTR
jgi:cyanophycinase